MSVSNLDHKTHYDRLGRELEEFAYYRRGQSELFKKTLFPIAQCAWKWLERQPCFGQDLVLYELFGVEIKTNSLFDYWMSLRKNDVPHERLVEVLNSTRVILWDLTEHLANLCSTNQKQSQTLLQSIETLPQQHFSEEAVHNILTALDSILSDIRDEFGDPDQLKLVQLARSAHELTDEINAISSETTRENILQFADKIRNYFQHCELPRSKNFISIAEALCREVRLTQITESILQDERNGARIAFTRQAAATLRLLRPLKDEEEKRRREIQSQQKQAFLALQSLSEEREYRTTRFWFRLRSPINDAPLRV